MLVGGAEVAQFDRDSNSYDIIPQVPQEFRDNPEKLGEYFVRSATGEMVPLSSVVTISTNASPAAIEQFNQLNSATISALPLPGVTTGDGLKALEDIAKESLPESFFIDYSGQSRQEKEQGNTILIAFAAAVIVIYLVLAAQFESFRDPLIIMMAVPLSIFGAIVPLNLGLGTLNIYTQVGLITLIGLITKHGILLVEFANQQREKHKMSRREAIIASAKVRLRPILMTTAAMALGVVPLIVVQRCRRRGALLDGPGDLHRHPGRNHVHSVRGADVLHLHRQQGPAASRREAGPEADAGAGGLSTKTRTKKRGRKFRPLF